MPSIISARMETDPQTERLPLTSADPLAERLAGLRELFPEAASEGKVDLEKLRALLAGGAARGDERERYGLSWAGKSDALKVIQTLTTATLVPAPGESEKWDTTGHAIIEGDNLEVLKVLQHAYARDGGKVKLIYIDPPYNTGGDFIYPDNYAEGLGSYLTYLGQVKDGIKQTTNLDTSGRYHSRWLTMMYPRLFLARNLLREDGVIFVSIDDHEVSNLRMVMDEIFGEENFIATIAWKGATDNNPTRIAIEHEYFICYARNADQLAGVWKNRTDNAKITLLAEYQRLRGLPGQVPEQIQVHLRSFIKANREALVGITHYDRVDERGVYTGSRKVHNPKPGGYKYDVPHDKTGKPCVPPVNGYRFPWPTMKQILDDKRILFGEDETQIIQIKEYLEDYQGKLSSVIAQDSRTGANEMIALFGEQKVFSTPKPASLLKEIFQFVSEGNDLVFDFFGGSGTTAQAVLELNKQDGGNRRFILVQLPEPTGREDFPTIAEITKERVRRVIKRMEGGRSGELPIGDGTKPDLGFKVFKLAESNFAIWNPALAATTPDALAEQWKLSADNVRAGAGETALLYELMLKSGLPLDTPAVAKDVAGAQVHLLDEGRMLICIARDLTREQLRAMAELKPQSVLCLDVAFKGNDALKVNADLEFQSHGIKFRTA